MANIWLDSTVKTYTDNFGIKTNPLVLDVGSRDGNSGYELAERISGGVIDHSKIVLFECNPPQIEVIKHNYPNATLIPYAISDVSGKTVDFVQMKGDQNIVGSSSMDLNRVNEPWLKDYEIIKVKTKRLDEIIEELGYQDTEIDVCKIDIEHYTYEALVSLSKYLRNIRVFHLETEPEPYARDKTNLDVALLMEQNGYKCCALENEWGESIQDQVWCRVD